MIDELMLGIASVVLGAGERLFDGVQDPGLEPVEAIHSPRGIPKPPVAVDAGWADAG